MSHYLLINPDELWLKGGNRHLYVKALRDHILTLCKEFDMKIIKLKNESQRLMLEHSEEFHEDFLEALTKVPGIHSLIPARRVEKSLEAIGLAAIEEVRAMGSIPATFKVQSKRVDKRFELNSMEISRRVGGYVLKEFDGHIKVDIKNPEFLIDVKVLADAAFISGRIIPGTGGLPVGTSGKLVTMLSGGFDSPVASYMMSKRGCTQTFVFFYAYPYVGDEVKEKITELASLLGTFQKNSRLYIVPFGEIQQKISKVCREEYRTMLFRKTMVQISNLLANRTKAGALVTGDALGQVSSQTLGNITLMDKSSYRPILRPLIGFNKAEVIALSRKIGAHDISVRPHDDACSLFAPKHPIISPDFKYWEKFSEEVDFYDDMKKALKEAEVYKISARGVLTLKE